MALIALSLLTVIRATVQDQPAPFGHWRVVGNGISGWLVLKEEPDRSIGGSLYENGLKGRYDAAARTYTLTLEQSCAPTPGQAHKEPFVIPLSLGLVGPDGRDLPLQLADKDLARCGARLPC